jgi:hypothetical protein
MTETIEKIFNEIKKNLTADHLKKITVDIIAAYKNKRYRHLKRYIPVLDIDPGTGIPRLFALLVKHYHPDKLMYILKQAEEIFRSGSVDGLRNLRDKYFFSLGAVGYDADAEIQFKAEYRFDQGDFGYRETTIAEEDEYGETGLEFREEAYGFMDAVNMLFFGGLDYALSEPDLVKLDGALDLSDCDISDLSGIEHCVYLEELNLSNNAIEKIGRLSALKRLRSLFISDNLIEDIRVFEEMEHLKEIDISFNNITDIAVLGNLHGLEYVNIIGNPIRDYSVINVLMKRGVIVIVEHTNLLF